MYAQQQSRKDNRKHGQYTADGGRTAQRNMHNKTRQKKRQEKIGHEATRREPTQGNKQQSETHAHKVAKRTRHDEKCQRKSKEPTKHNATDVHGTKKRHMTTKKRKTTEKGERHRA